VGILVVAPPAPKIQLSSGWGTVYIFSVVFLALESTCVRSTDSESEPVFSMAVYTRDPFARCISMVEPAMMYAILNLKTEILHGGSKSKGCMYIDRSEAIRILLGIVAAFLALPVFSQATTAPVHWARYTMVNGLPSNRVLCVVADADQLWAGTDNGLALISHGKITKVFTPKDGLPGRAVTALSLDKNTGDLWIATYGGVSHYSAGIFQSYTSLASGLANDIVYDIVAEGDTVWAATAAGLSRLDTRTGSWTTFDSRNAPMSDPWPVGIAFDEGNAYVATWGSGVLDYNIAKDQWATHALGQSSDSHEVDNAQESNLDFVNAVAYDSISGTLWIADRHGILWQTEHFSHRFTADDSGQPFGYINRILLRGAELWVCSDRGLKVLNTKTAQWRTYSVVPSFESGRASSLHKNSAISPREIPQGQVFGVAFQNNDIWVATDNGLSLGTSKALPVIQMTTDGGNSPIKHGYLTNHNHGTSAMEKGFPEDRTKVSIGFLGPLEDSSDVSHGLAMLHGAQLAIDEANQRDEHPGGPHKARWTYALKTHSDTAPWGMSTVEPVKMALDEHVVAVLGAIDGSTTHTLLRISSELGFPVLNTGTRDSSIRDTGTPWLMQLISDDRQQSCVLARYIHGQIKMQKLGIIREDARYARVGTEDFKKVIKQDNPVQIVETTFQSGTTDFSEQLQQLREADIDGLVIWSQPTEGALILKQLRDSKMHIPAFGPSELSTPQLISLAGASSEGFVAVGDFKPMRKDQEYEKFKQQYRQQFDEAPDEYASYSYDGISLLIATIEKTGPDRQQVNDILHRYQYQSLVDVTGPKLFASPPNFSTVTMIARVEGGRFVYWAPIQP